MKMGRFVYKIIWAAIQLAADSAKLAGDESRFNGLVAAARTYQYESPNGANPDWFQQLAPESFYHQWLNCSPNDEYWQRRSPGAQWQNPTIPVLQIGGWFDPHLRGNLRLYEALKTSGVTQKLVIGPWGHFPWGRRTGGQDYGAAAVSRIDALQLAWFDHYLKQQPARFESSRLELFDLGTYQWRQLPDFPTPEQQQCWYLHSQGLGTTSGSGLSSVPVPGCNPDVWVHDPWRPVPSLGGHAASPAGTFDRASLDDRADVVTYTSTPFNKPITICGSPQLSLTIEADCPSFDLAIAVSEVTPDGRVLPFSHSISHAPPANRSSRSLKISLQATCVTLPVGSCLRVSLSGASFPAYPVNSGTEQSPTQSTRMAHQVITLAVMSNEDQPAVMALPILANGAYPNSREVSP